jgi:hypothetical protein
MRRWKRFMIVTIRPWCTGDRIVSNILLSGFVTYFILIYYISLLSQGMNYELGVSQG